MAVEEIMKEIENAHTSDNTSNYTFDMLKTALKKRGISPVDRMCDVPSAANVEASQKIQKN